jgi:thiol-disulfide isomerase/thioredoxin
VKLLTSETFKSDVLHSSKPWLIMYFSETCSHCHNFAPQLEKLATKLKHICNVGAVNCDKHRKTCKHVKGYPEFHLFAEDDEDERSPTDAIQYVGPHDGGKLGNWVLRQLPTNVVHLKKFADFEKEFIDGKKFLTLPTCIFIHSKTNVPPLFSAVARDFAKVRKKRKKRKKSNSFLKKNRNLILRL